MAQVGVRVEVVRFTWYVLRLKNMSLR